MPKDPTPLLTYSWAPSLHGYHYSSLFFSKENIVSKRKLGGFVPFDFTQTNGCTMRIAILGYQPS